MVELLLFVTSIRIKTMAHFAKIDPYGTVVDITKIADADCKDENDNESEAKGIAKCREIFPNDTAYDFKQTSYNSRCGEHGKQESSDSGELTFGGKASFRKNYASVGGKYDYERDAFIPNRMFPQETTLKEDEGRWVSPYQAKQTTDGKGKNLKEVLGADFDDATDYTVTSNYNPFGWVWDNEKKTYYRTNPTDTVNVTYSYNSSTHMWEKG